MSYRFTQYRPRKNAATIAPASATIRNEGRCSRSHAEAPRSGEPGCVASDGVVSTEARMGSRATVPTSSCEGVAVGEPVRAARPGSERLLAEPRLEDRLREVPGVLRVLR